MMLGTMRLERGLYSAREPTLAGEFSPERLATAIASLPTDIYPRSEDLPPTRDITQAESAAIETVKDGAFAERDGAIVVRSGAGFEALNLSESVAARVRGMLAVRDAVRLVFQTQLNDEPEDRILEARQLLNRAYDGFVRRHGPLSSKENVKAFAGDPDHPLLLSLETYDPETKRAAKTAIFERRTLERYRPVEHVETAAEALAISLNETGEINWPRMEQVTGRTARLLQSELGSLVYRNPEGRTLGDRRLLSQRQCPGETLGRAQRRRAGPLLPSQHRGAWKPCSPPTFSQATSRRASAHPGFPRPTSGISWPRRSTFSQATCGSRILTRLPHGPWKSTTA